MPSIVDDRGYNQGFKASKSVEIRTQRRCAYMASLMRPGSGARILEIGCGTGRLAYMLAEKTGNYVLGTDICGPFIEQAKAAYSLPNLKYQRLDFNDPSEIRGVVKDHKFDYVVGDGILHHLYYNLDESLKNINSLLADNGKMIFLEPNFFNPYCQLIFHVGIFRKLAKLEPLEMTFTTGFIKKKLEGAGFSPILAEYRDFLVPGTPDFLIPAVVNTGAVIEKIPLLKMFSQSLFISADKKPD